MKGDESGDFVRTGDLAAALGVRTGAVREMIEAGEVAAIRARKRGHHRIPREEAERVVREARRRVSG